MRQRSPMVITACILGIVLAGLSLYFGALLPFRKGQSYISAQRRLAQVRTVEDFRMNFDAVFGLYSPVGTEEITKFLAGSILGNVSDQSEAASRQIAAYIEPRLFKDDVRHLMLAGQIRRKLWERFGAEEDYAAAIDYLQKAHEIGPNLPTPLYSLMNVYAAAGDTPNALRIAEAILERWPDDPQARAVLEDARL